MWRVEGEISLPEKLRLRFSIQETGHGTAKVFEILWWKLRGNWGQTRWAPTSLTLMQAFGRSCVVGKHTPEKKHTQCHNTADGRHSNQFGKSFIYPMIRTVFSKISPGVQTPSTIPLYYSMLLNSWMKTWETPHNCFQNSCFFIFIFFSGTILKFEHLKDFFWFCSSSRSTFTSPGLLPGFLVHWNFGGFLGGKTPWRINLFCKYTV